MQMKNTDLIQSQYFKKVPKESIHLSEKDYSKSLKLKSSSFREDKQEYIYEYNSQLADNFNLFDMNLERSILLDEKPVEGMEFQ
jgi:hypothetical protein